LRVRRRFSKENRRLDWPPPTADSVVAYLRRFQDRGGTATFNLLCYQDGSALDTDLDVMRQVKKKVRAGHARR